MVYFLISGEKSDLVYDLSMLHVIVERTKELADSLSIESHLDAFETRGFLGKAIYEAPPKAGLGASSALSVALSTAMIRFMQEHDYLKEEIITTKKGGLSKEEKKYVFQVAIGPRLVTTLRTEVARYKDAMQEIRNYTSLTSLFVSTFGTPYEHGNIFFRKGFKGTFPIMDSFDFNEDTLPILIADRCGEIPARPPTQKKFKFKLYVQLQVIFIVH